MDVLVLASIAVGLFVLRAFARRWVVERWLRDDLTNRQVAGLFIGLALAPFALITALVVWGRPGFAPLVLIGPLVIGVSIVLLMLAAFDFMAARGIKEHLRRQREHRS